MCLGQLGPSSSAITDLSVIVGCAWTDPSADARTIVTLRHTIPPRMRDTSRRTFPHNCPSVNLSGSPAPHQPHHPPRAARPVRTHEVPRNRVSEDRARSSPCPVASAQEPGSILRSNVSDDARITLSAALTARSGALLLDRTAGLHIDAGVVDDAG